MIWGKRRRNQYVFFVCKCSRSLVAKKHDDDCQDFRPIPSFAPPVIYGADKAKTEQQQQQKDLLRWIESVFASPFSWRVRSETLIVVAVCVGKDQASTTWCLRSRFDSDHFSFIVISIYRAFFWRASAPDFFVIVPRCTNLWKEFFLCACRQ